MIEVNIGKNLKDIREKRNLSMDEVEVATGIAKSTLSRYERNITEPTIRKLMQLSSLYGVTMDEICNKESIGELQQLPQGYIDAVKKMIDNGITADYLNKYADLLKEMK